jgi:hypothetical protein
MNRVDGILKAIALAEAVAAAAVAASSNLIVINFTRFSTPDTATLARCFFLLFF